MEEREEKKIDEVKGKENKFVFKAFKRKYTKVCYGERMNGEGAEEGKEEKGRSRSLRDGRRGRSVGENE